MRQTEEAGPMGAGGDTIDPLRRWVGQPASQSVSLGTALYNLLERLEREMNERAITKP